MLFSKHACTTLSNTFSNCMTAPDRRIEQSHLHISTAPGQTNMKKCSLQHIDPQHA
jgi:hypothetical protein